MIDYIPTWGWLTLAGVLVGGGGAALALVPGLLAAAVGVYNALPRPVRYVLAGLTFGALAYAAGRYRGRQNELERARVREAGALANRAKINREVAAMTPSEIDKELARRGELRKD